MVPGRTIVFSSSLPADSGGAVVAAGVRDELDFAGYRLQVALIPPGSSAAAEEERASITRCLGESEIAGMILVYVGDAANVALARRVRERGKAVVFLGRLPVHDPDFDAVSIDNAMAARQVTEHLIAQGHRSIAHITTNEEVSAVLDRRAGYRHALAAAGIPYRPELVVPHDSDRRGIAVSQALLRSLLALPDPPTAIFAVHDWAAMLTMLTAHLIGLRLPGDLAVAGFDGIERLRRERPLVTTVETPFERLGRQAAKLAVDRLEGRLGAGTRQVVLEAPLHVRFSTNAGLGTSLLDESAWRRRIAYHYMSENVDRDLTSERLASYVGVSVSTLYQDFHRLGYPSPMRELLLMRMEQVRWDLLHPQPDTTVSGCAERYGIGHLGRFSAAYQAYYGELPSQTLQRGRAQGPTG